MNILRHANVGDEGRHADAETAPLRAAEYYRFDFDVTEITELWRRSSVVASWLLDLTAHALHDDRVPAHVLKAALCERFSSRGEVDFTDQVLSAMRREFGGHTEVAAA